jgi:hypothetical protein
MTGIIGTIGSILGSSAIGSIIGGVLAIFNRKMDMQAKRDDQAHETQRWTHERGLRADDLAIAQAEANAKIRVAQEEGDASVESARMKAIADTNATDNVTADELKAAGWWKWLLVMASAYRKSLRSLLTTVLVGGAIYTTMSLIFRLDEAMQTTQTAILADLVFMSVNWLCGQASATIQYWFVARGNAEGKAK